MMENLSLRQSTWYSKFSTAHFEKSSVSNETNELLMFC